MFDLAYLDEKYCSTRQFAVPVTEILRWKLNNRSFAKRTHNYNIVFTIISIIKLHHQAKEWKWNAMFMPTNCSVSIVWKNRLTVRLVIFCRKYLFAINRTQLQGQRRITQTGIKRCSKVYKTSKHAVYSGRIRVFTIKSCKTSWNYLL